MGAESHKVAAFNRLFDLRAMGHNLRCAKAGDANVAILLNDIEDADHFVPLPVLQDLRRAGWIQVEERMLSGTQYPADPEFAYPQSLCLTLLRNHRAEEASSYARVVFLVHGIRDRAEWYRVVAEAMDDDDTFVTGPMYGRYGLFRFLCPWFLGGKALNQVRASLERVCEEHPESEVTVIAHSFGTHLTAEAMASSQRICVRRLIICGSVLPQSFDWSRTRHAFAVSHPRDAQVINECGDRDLWPALGAAAVLRHGATGTDGGGDAKLVNRFHRGGHSLFFSKPFIRKWWRSCIVDGVVRPSPSASGVRIPLWARCLRLLPLHVMFWSVVLAALLVLALVVWCLV